MPFSFPSLADLRQQVRANFAARLPGADQTLRVGALPITADNISGGLFAGFRSLVWLSKQLFIDSAEAPYLDRRIGIYGINRTGASVAAGNAIFYGTNGISVPSGTLLQSSDGTIQLATQAIGTIASGSVTVPIESITTGAAANLAASAPLTIIVAIAGVNPIANVDGSGLSGGADQETDADFRVRGLARIQQPPQGGAATDYVAWAKLTAGVTRAWVYPLHRGVGTVDVTFVMDGRVSNIPLSGDVTAVAAAIAAMRPVTADVSVWAPTADALAITVHAMVPNDATTQANVTAALNALALTVPAGSATVGDGVSSANPGGTLYLSQIEAAIESVGNMQHFDLALPAADVSYALGHVPAVPTIAFT